MNALFRQFYWFGLAMVNLGLSRRMARALALSCVSRWACIAILTHAATGEVGINQARAADKAPDLKTIQAAVDLYSQRVKSLKGKFIKKFTREPGATYPLPGNFPGDHRTETTFLADIRERKTFLDERKSYWEQGVGETRVPFGIHDLRAFDGTSSYQVEHSHFKSAVETELPPDLPMILTISTGKSKISSQYMLWDFAGFRGSGLANALRHPGIKVERMEDANGASCVRVAQVEGNVRPLVVWLDPRHDFLPRRIELRRPLDGKISVHDRFDIMESRKFPDAAGGNEIWFPVRAKVWNYMQTIQEFEVVELTISTVTCY